MIGKPGLDVSMHFSSSEEFLCCVTLALKLAGSLVGRA